MLTPTTDDGGRRHYDEYALYYDDGRESERIWAASPSDAVIKRRQGFGSLLPHTIINISRLAEWRESLDRNKEIAHGRTDDGQDTSY